MGQGAEPWLVLAVGLVALLYSAVGHGGASGYLAVLALASVPHRTAATLALVLNLIVAGIALIQYVRAGHFDWRKALPFLIGSVPLAFVGGAMKTSDRVYEALLAVVLVAAALRFLIRFPAVVTESTKHPAPSTAVAVGAGIGLVSGIVGVGGGIFLSPVMLLARWADAKKTAAVSACFILANSLAGLAGKRVQAPLDLLLTWPILAAGVAGALIGSQLGARKLQNQTIQRVLGVVLIVAALKAVFAP